MGIVVPYVANPRIGLSAHTGTLVNGEIVAYWLVVAGSYVSCAALFLAGVFGTSRSTPLHGAGHAGAPWDWRR